MFQSYVDGYHFNLRIRQQYQQIVEHQFLFCAYLKMQHALKMIFRL